MLGLVRVVRSAVDLQLLDLLAAELALREHPADRLLDEPLRIARLEIARRDRAELKERKQAYETERARLVRVRNVRPPLMELRVVKVTLRSNSPRRVFLGR